MMLTSRMRRKSLSGISSKGAKAVTAAQLTQTSIRPKRSATLSATSRTAFSSVISAGTGKAVAPEPSHSPATAFNAAGRRAVNATVAPPAANFSAVARPIPLDAPVTTTTEPLVRITTPLHKIVGSALDGLITEIALSGGTQGARHSHSRSIEQSVVPFYEAAASRTKALQCTKQGAGGGQAP